MVPGFGLGPLDSPQAAHYTGQPSPPYAVTSTTTFGSDSFELRPTKRQRLSQSSARRPSVDQSKPYSQTQPQAQALKGHPAPTKSKRVRTGCLTCRERHLKCDEATPDCLNCQKSNRECKRGVRLNFIDVQVKTPPYLPPSDEWIVQFQDESRLIASEYQGGLIRYAGADQALITPPRTVDGTQSRVTTVHKQQKAKKDVAVAALGLDSRRHTQLQLSRQFCNEQTMQMDGCFDGNQVHTRHNSEVSLVAPPSSHLGAYGMQLHDHFKEESRGGHIFKESPISTPPGSVVTHTARPSSSFPGSQDSRHPSPPDGLMTPPQDGLGGDGDGSDDLPGSEVLSKPDQVMYMQLFVEEVGPWMDSMDRSNHFSHVIPYRAARSPMLLNAILACGVRHLTLLRPDDKSDSIALVYYNTASTLLLRNLQNPDRDMVECATTACVLNVFEIMSERPAERMNHIAGARALIKECGWNARSTGIGAACFWLNVGMEVLSCLSFNWKCSWEPDQWGVDMDFGDGDKGEDAEYHVLNGFEDNGNNTGMAGEHGDEEIWIYRIFYVLGKIANFKASIPRFQEACPLDEQMRLRARYADWQKLKALADKWSSSCPRTMRPFGYVQPSKFGKSKFPNVWLIKRPAVIGRLFYHTAQCLLAQINPLVSRDSEPAIQAATHHARQVCGIAAHTKDRGVASISIRPLAIASHVLKDREEQTEVIAILDKIHSETGWRLGKVYTELKKAWGWEGSPKPLGPIPAATTSITANSPNAGGNPLSAPSTCAGYVLPAAASGGLKATQPRSRSVASSPSLHQQQEDQRAQARQHQQQQIAAAQQLFAATRNMSLSSVAASVPTTVQPAPKVPVPISQLGGDNPLVAADFNLPNHPYDGFYQPPANRTGAFTHSFF